MSCAVRFAVVLALAGIPLAQAQVHVCTDANGRKVYSDESCGKDAKIVDTRSGMGRATIYPGTTMSVEHYDIRSCRAAQHEGWR